MNFISSLFDICSQDSVNLFRLSLEKNEIESFCKVTSLKNEDALSALRDLKAFLNIEDCLNFEKLNGGDCNAPILAFKSINNNKIPIGVLKHEPNSSWADKRMKAMDEMKSDGFEQLPRILKDLKGNFLVKLGEISFSCIEYLEPDSDQLSSIEQMFMLASKFHAFSNRSSLIEELRSRTLDRYSNESSFHLAPELIQWNPLIFKTEAWANCIKCAHYFTSQSFLKIYNSLPTQLIHGDITPNNIILSKGKSFFIDLDKVRTDVRLLDFATFLGWSYLEGYLTLTEENKLLPCIRTCYGKLEEIEEEHFHIIVLFGRCCVLEWSLRELKQALYDKDVQKEQQFGNIFKGTLREINEIYNRIPQIKETLQ